MMRRLCFIGGFGVVLAAGAAALAFAQSGAASYPDHPVRVIVSVPAGGGVDTVTRIVADKMSRALGRPLVDTITNSKIANLKELRPGSRGRSKVRILFVFDPWRSAILLVAGDKAGNWNKWYARMIPRAEQLYEIYLKERAAEEGSQ